jgi:hypothetical protein
VTNEPETSSDHSPGVCGRFYPALAVSMLTLAFLPLFEPVDSDGISTEYGTVFDMAGRQGGGPAVFGILVLAVLIGLMVTAAIRVPSRTIPLAIAGAAALVIVMLITKPGTGTPTPDLSDTGQAGIALGVAAIVVAIVQVADLSRRRDVAGTQ